MNLRASNIRVDAETGCWLWAGRLDRHGYGKQDGQLVHRLYYAYNHGEIPAGVEISHSCRVRHCVNPAHLLPMSRLEVVRWSIPATKTHCKKGHPLDEANTYRRPDGHRACRACNRAAVAALKARKAGAA